MLWAPIGAAGLPPADKCESSELKTSGTYGFCRLTADAKAVKTGDPVDYSKCDAKFADKFGQADTQGMGQCPSSASQAAIQAIITQCTDDVAIALGGGPLSFCQTPPLKTGQTTAYGTGSDGDLQKGASRSLTDNGDGTITDNSTGLMWEKKSDDGTIHDKDDFYTWGLASGPYTMNGTMVTTFLATLNGGGFAGYTDWRIPNRFELESIVHLQNLAPSVDAAFNTSCAATCTVTTCSCTQPFDYWSSTTHQGSPDRAWRVDFSAGEVSASLASGQSSNFYVRAVRGGA